jgi:DNA-binding phage protein
MSRKETKQQTIDRLLAELKAQQDINAKLANVLKMTDDGQWVVISEKDLNRYRNGIDALLKAGNAVSDYLAEIKPEDETAYIIQLWKDAKGSDKF